MSNQDPITPRCYRYNKRKCTALDTSAKKSKINNQPIDWNYMVSASSTRNYLLHDPLIDYLNEYNITSLDKIPGANPRLPLNHLYDKRNRQPYHRQHLSE